MEATPDRARLSVRDHGVGIPAADLERIFGRFERANVEDHFGRLGLGLYLARRIVDGHGGTLQVASEPGAGSVFTIDLPRPRVARGPPARRFVSPRTRLSLRRSLL